MPRELPPLPEAPYPYCATVKLTHGNQATFSNDLGVRAGKTKRAFAQLVVGYNQEYPVRVVTEQQDVIFRPSTSIGMKNGRLRTNSKDAIYVGGKYRISVIAETQGVRVRVESQIPVTAVLVGKKRQIATHLNMIRENPALS